MDFSNKYICPITHKTVEEMVNPVCAPDGYTYEKEAIVHWLRNNGTSPITREIMNIDSLVDNRALKNDDNVKIQQNKDGTIDICIVWDTSGSMSSEAEFLNDKGNSEKSGLSYHDLVKHAIHISKNA